MIKIFISYRRQDTRATAGRIYDRLEAVYGRNFVFMDVDSIPIGVDFRVHLANQVAQCQVLLAIIGHGWTGPTPNGDRRIDNSGDFVRLEIESALSRGIPVIPVFVDRCPILSESELPPSLAGLAFHNGMEIDNGRDFNSHVERLRRGIDHLAMTHTRLPSTPENAAIASSTIICDACGGPASIRLYDFKSRQAVGSGRYCLTCMSSVSSNEQNG